MKDILAKMVESSTFWAAIAGASGGIVRTLSLKEKFWPDGPVNLVVGALSAAYLYPIGKPLLEMVIGSFVMDENRILTLSGFLIGIAGVGISGFVLDTLRGFVKRFQRSQGGPDA